MITPDDLYAEEDNDLERIEEEPNEAAENEDAPQSGEEAETADGANRTVVKPKRVVRNPQPKLNEETLRGKRGITTLESYFENVKYKGKGYEEQDLATILKTYEYWCHRLFPKYPFDACIEKIEHLGLKKKLVKTFIKKIRLDMVNDDDARPVDDVVLDSDTEDNNLTHHMNDDDDNLGRENFDQFDELINNINTRPDSPSTSTSAPVEITEELQERIRRNRERAQRLRQERLRQANEIEESSSTVFTASQISTQHHSDEEATGESPSKRVTSSQISIQHHNDEEETGESSSKEVTSSQISTQHHSDEEMDVDNIFNQIQHSNEQENMSQKIALKMQMTPQSQFSDDED